MLIQSDFIPCAFWGQVASWTLDILPWLESMGYTRPKWHLRSKIYCQPPDYNLFPDFIQTIYEPLDDDGKTLSWEELHYSNNPKPFDTVGRMFNGDFQKAHDIWMRWFRLNPKITSATDKWCLESGISEKTLGIHFRSTDKMAAPSLGETNIVTPTEFISIVDDFLLAHPDINRVFATSDAASFMELIKKACDGKIAYCEHSHVRSTTGAPLYFYSKPLLIPKLARECIEDFWTLTKCEYLLSNFSAFSAWPKIYNPQQKNFRTNACKPRYWFPHGFTELYKGKQDSIQELLARLQEGNWSKQNPETGVIL